MARIRTIKPEFPQSETIGKLSRDARLCFIMMWTIADDSGRLRGNSRILASLLFPYDDDAAALIDDWVSELVTVGAVIRYQVEGSTYIQIAKWLEHQKIDKPSPSKLPEFAEASRVFAEASATDLGPRTLDQEGKGKEEEPRERVAAPPSFDQRYRETQECCEAILNSPNCLVWGRVDAWLKSGADPELDIYPTLERLKPRWKGRHLDYFDDAIADSIASRTKPLPAGQARASPSERVDVTQWLAEQKGQRDDAA